MTSDSHVTAVVVTYNRADLLRETLAALQQQARKPNRLVVVDNASADHTSEVIDAFSREHGFEDFELVRSDTNTGGAGGFHAGMRRALELGTDWVWTMDDDVAPAARCLAVLMSHSDISECLHPQRIGIGGTAQPWEPISSIATGTTTFLDNVSFAHGKEIAYTNVACFEGALISTRIIELVGLPDPAYFIIGDDTVFGLKASAHTNVVIARDAHMHRLLAMTSFAPWKVYYLARNAFYVRSEACEYLGISPTKVQNFVFRLNLALELSRHVRRGRGFFGPTFRGWRDGSAYDRKRRRRRAGPELLSEVQVPLARASSGDHGDGSVLGRE